jgi:immunoglobulin-like protein involved in spore germination
MNFQFEFSTTEQFLNTLQNPAILNGLVGYLTTKILKMKFRFILLLVIITGCNADDDAGKTTINSDTVTTKTDHTRVDNKADDTIKPPKPPIIYSNARFKDVTVEKIGEQKFRIKGKGQIFEANFNWVIEDGHEELKQGFQMTDAGAPEWGNFDFTVEAIKKRANSTLHLVLFETSAKDGSRQYELALLLY